jgi:hypothetical protein
VLPTRVASEILADAALKDLLRKGAYSEAVLQIVRAIRDVFEDDWNLQSDLPHESRSPAPGDAGSYVPAPAVVAGASSRRDQLRQLAEEEVTKSSVKKRVRELSEQALRLEPGEQSYNIWTEVHQLDPGNAEARFFLGKSLINHPDLNRRLQSASLILSAFDTSMEPPLSSDTLEAYQTAFMVGLRQYLPETTQRSLLKIAAGSRHPHDDCAAIKLATLTPRYPPSTDMARNVIRGFHTEVDTLLAQPSLTLADTPSHLAFQFCFALPLVQAFYMDPGNRFAEKFFRLTTKAMPSLVYTAPHLASTQKRSRPNSGKVAVGIASSYFLGDPRGNPMLALIIAIFDRLSRDKLDLSLIFVPEDSTQKSEYLTSRQDIDRTLTIGAGASPETWLQDGREQIADLRLDLLVYIDVISPTTRIYLLALSRLARVQACSWGSTTTSGFSRDIMQYYIGWAGHELPLQEAQQLYTEKLVLLPADTPQFFFEPKVDGDRSLITGAPFRQITRLDVVPTATGERWYTCMQFTFKRSPQFDVMIASILSKDAGANVILLEEPFSTHDQAGLETRLKEAGADMSRIFFLKKQDHHVLLALYAISDVIIDSYIAGAGGNTALEAFEVGGILVSLPDKMQSSRNVLGFYNLMGFPDGLGLLAESPEHYVDIAVRVATSSPQYKADLRRKLSEGVLKLFRRGEVVKLWQDTLLDLADVSV